MGTTTFTRRRANNDGLDRQTRLPFGRYSFRDGVRAAIAFLNSLTTHRFTALYLFDGHVEIAAFGTARTPRHNRRRTSRFWPHIAVYVRDSSSTFATSDSLQDERVAGHPKRLQVQAYCGVPLLDDDGRVFGTICHFDLWPMAISDENVTLLEAFSQLLPQSKCLDSQSS